MDSALLEAQLAQWANEYADIAGVTLDVPGKLWVFLSQRIAELGIGVEEPFDVVRMNLDGTTRKVRITGHTQGRLSWSYADGSPGFGFALVSSVLESDRPKLADILDEIEGQQCQLPTIKSKSCLSPTT